MNSNGTDDDNCKNASTRLRSENSSSNSSIINDTNNGIVGDSNSPVSTSIASMAITTSLEHQQRQHTQPPPPSPKTYTPLNNTTSFIPCPFGSTSPVAASTTTPITTPQRQNRNLGGSASSPSLSLSVSSNAKAKSLISSASARAKQHFKSPTPASSSSSSSRKVSKSSQARLRQSASSVCASMHVPNHQSNNNHYGGNNTDNSVSAMPNHNHYNQQHRSVGTASSSAAATMAAAGTTTARRRENHVRAAISNTGTRSGEGESRERKGDEEIIKGKWKTVEVDDDDNASSTSSPPPCERSLHAGTLWNDQLLIFGGYDGQNRRNDFYSFHLKKQRWNLIIANNGNDNNTNSNAINSVPSVPPTPRDRHCAVAYKNSFYIFGGFDGTSRVNDFYEFDFTTMVWKRIVTNVANSSALPSPRHSHSAVVYQDSMFVFGGYDGSYRSDFYEYNFLNNTWTNIHPIGRSPRARYRATTVTYKNKMILYGGHDGTRHLSDMHVFDLDKRIWSVMEVTGTSPIARDSHISAVYENSMYVFGGSAGSALNDIHELRLGKRGGGGEESEDEGSDNFVPEWKSVVVSSGSVSRRFCHVGALYSGSLYVFGGYDGNQRLNDFMKFEFNFDDLSYSIPQSTLVTDMRSFVNNELLSDVVFIVEGKTVHAHKLMLVRCNYFRAMLTGSMMESQSSTIHLEDMSYKVFLSILEYLYTDGVRIEVENAMELFAAADLFGIPRLQGMCERKILQSIHPENAATIFHAADEHSAIMLRSKALNFILKHFEEVSKSEAFEEMARNNVLLVIEILRLR